jgi:hypothetical protein
MRFTVPGLAMPGLLVAATGCGGRCGVLDRGYPVCGV